MASIKKRTDGRYRARYRDEHGREHARHFVRKIDAQNWLDEVTASVVTGQYVDPKAGRITFADYFASSSTRQVWAPGTARAMRLAAGSVTFSDTPLRAIRRSHVEQWIKGMVAKPLAASTITTRVNNVRSVLRAAVRDRLIASDPSDGVTLPRKRRVDAAMSIPTGDQVGALLRSAAPAFQAFIALTAFAGLRLGEAAGLRVSDVNFLGRTLDVRRQVQRENGGGVEIRAPKYGSERAIPIPDGLVTILSEHVRLHRQGEAPDRWLFLGENDLPPHQNTVGYWWRQAKTAASVTGVRLHDMRHWYASGLIADGCDPVTVQRALGHAKATTTLNTYAHLWPTAEDRTRQAAGRLVAETVGSSADSLRTRDAQ